MSIWVGKQQLFTWFWLRIENGLRNWPFSHKHEHSYHELCISPNALAGVLSCNIYLDLVPILVADFVPPRALENLLWVLSWLVSQPAPEGWTWAGSAHFQLHRVVQRGPYKEPSKSLNIPEAFLGVWK